MADDDLKHLLETMHRESALAHAETRQQVVETHQLLLETRRDVDENRRRFEVVVEQMETKFDLLAESVGSFGQNLQEMRTSFEAKLERSAAETQAMIKFSHRDLDRRVTALEDAVTGLQARVERLETSPH